MGKTGGEEVCLLKYEIQCAKYIIEKDIIEEKWNEIHIFAWIGEVPSDREATIKRLDLEGGCGLPGFI